VAGLRHQVRFVENCSFWGQDFILASVCGPGRPPAEFGG
jgi:hypothetical protein